MPSLPPSLRDRDFRRLWFGMLGAGFGTQMVSVAVGWQVYAIHRRAFDLGLIGLAEFLPLLLLALPAGQLADRLPRTLIAAASSFAEAAVVGLLLIVTLHGARQLWAYVTLAAGIMLARKPLGGRAGRTLLVAVGIFGASIVVFGLSHWFIVSFLALAVSGFVDMLSMNIRSTTVALATPNELRGRVNSVEGVFISASNELGAFESGAAAALLGAVPAVVAGGAITIFLALVWKRLFPALARVDRLEDVRPETR
jgi:MFS family permease